MSILSGLGNKLDNMRNFTYIMTDRSVLGVEKWKSPLFVMD